MFKKLWLENQEVQQKKKEHERDERMRANLAKRHKQEMMRSCPHGKVRSYACHDGVRVLKQISYHYDFDEEKCVEKSKKKTISCYEEEERNYDNEESD